MTDDPQAPSQGTETPLGTTAPTAPTDPPVEPTSGQNAAPNPPAEPTSDPETPAERIVPAPSEYKLAEGTPAQLGEVFNKLDMTQTQAEGVLQLDQAREKARIETLAAAGKAHITSWGDSAKTNLNLAIRGLEHIDPSGGLKELLNTTGFGNDPKVLELMYQYGKRMEEGGFLPNTVNSPKTQPKDVAHLWYPNDAPGGKNTGYNS